MVHQESLTCLLTWCIQLCSLPNGLINRLTRHHRPPAARLLLEGVLVDVIIGNALGYVRSLSCLCTLLQGFVLVSLLGLDLLGLPATTNSHASNSGHGKARTILSLYLVPHKLRSPFTHCSAQPAC